MLLSRKGRARWRPSARRPHIPAMRRVANQKYLTYVGLEEQIGVTAVLCIVRIPTVCLLDRVTTLATREENKESRAVVEQKVFTVKRHKSLGFQRVNSQATACIASSCKTHSAEDTRVPSYLTLFNCSCILENRSIAFLHVTTLTCYRRSMRRDRDSVSHKTNKKKHEYQRMIYVNFTKVPRK